ncbi:MAG: hypothetical protein C4576_06520 [Desulfobacteraceae bacterium]|nr:MAG: hypothetical protein C4576_06520 [Desulfobacteraceae bacterium]
MEGVSALLSNLPSRNGVGVLYKGTKIAWISTSTLRNPSTRPLAKREGPAEERASQGRFASQDITYRF